VTVGNSGDPKFPPIVTNRNLLGTFTYAQNMFSSWLQIKVDEKEMLIKAKGLDNEGQIIDLYSITINRGMRMNTWLMLVIGVVAVIVLLSCIVFFCLNRRTEQLKTRRDL
jgi:hypothetical protein